MPLRSRWRVFLGGFSECWTGNFSVSNSLLIGLGLGLVFSLLAYPEFIVALSVVSELR